MTTGATPIKSKGKSPAAQWYWADWLRDPALRSVTSGARGLWMDILCLMWECVPKGHLQTRTGQPFSVEMICRMTGNISEEEVNRWLLELENSGVSSRTTTGVLYSRRMVRDEHKRAACREAGKRGGNPALKGVVKGQSKGQSKGGVKRKPTPSSSTSVEDVPLLDHPFFASCLDEFRSQRFLDAWSRWERHRREIKKALKPTQIGAQLIKLQEIGIERAIGMIDHTIAMGWQGLREPDGKPAAGDLFAGQREFMERRRNATASFD